MTYRDDREALQSRVRELEEDLGSARREGEEQGREAARQRADELEKKLASVRGDLERMGAELQELRGVPAKKPIGPVLLVAGLALAGVSVGAYLMLATSSQAPLPPPPPPPVLPAAEPLQPIVPLPPPTPAPVPVEPAKPVEPEAAVRSATPRWRATVKHAEGLALAPGSSCLVEATVQTRKTNATVPALTVTCGSQVLYSSKDRLNGMASLDNDARERLGRSDEKSTFTLQYSDIGARTGARAQVDLDTTKRQGSAFRETVPRYRVDFTLPIESEPTAPLAGPDQRLRRNARVTEVSGAAPVKVGASCLLRAMPTGKQSDCVAELQCGATTLFPTSTGAVQCSYTGPKVTSADLAEGPLQLSLTDSTMTVKSTGAKAFQAVLGIEP